MVLLEIVAETTDLRRGGLVNVTDDESGKTDDQRKDEPMALDGLRIMCDVAETPLEWLWAGYLPLGECSIVEGDPGTNKSSLLYDVAARLTRGHRTVHSECVSRTF